MFSQNLAFKVIRCCDRFLVARSSFRRELSCHSASITKIHRNSYARIYPTVVVLPDGSSTNIRYHEPRKIIKLPIDLSTLSDEERRQRIERRKPKKKVQVEEDLDDNFDASKYINLFKK